MVSTVPGTRGSVAWYCRSEGDSAAHRPGTAGDSVGIGLFGARSVENCTEMVDALSTLLPVGAVCTTVSRGGGFAVVADATGAWGREITMNPIAATPRTKVEVPMTHRRAPVRFVLGECLPVAMGRGVYQWVYGFKQAERSIWQW
jgi:hypothetical protein